MLFFSLLPPVVLFIFLLHIVLFIFLLMWSHCPPPIALPLAT
jgi:hypothetical protein